jgi:hypothetical protein
MEDTKTKSLTLEDVKEILSKIVFADYSMLDFDWDFEVKIMGDQYMMRTSFIRKDIDNGEVSKGWGRWYSTSISGASEKGIIMTGWLCIEQIIKHELLEGFEYNGVKVFDPHKSLDELVYPKTL